MSFLPDGPRYQAWSPDDLVVSSADADGVRTIAAVAGKIHVLKKILWGYSALPTAGLGLVQVTDAAALVFEMPITASGPGSWDFGDDPIVSAAVNTALVVTIKAAGASNVGRIITRYRDVSP